MESSILAPALLSRSISAALAPRGRTLGVITFAMAESGRRYSPTDLPLVEDLARRAALAVDNARLYREAHQARMEAEAANRGKDQFLSVFSHELRSPLNAILGWNRILALKRPDDTEVASITARIEHSARAQLKMVNDLLDLARIETGKLRIEARPMQLAKVVAATLDLARPSAAAKGITFQADFEPGAGVRSERPSRARRRVISSGVTFSVKIANS